MTNPTVPTRNREPPNPSARLSLFRSGLITAIWLSALFFLVYGGSNWLTSQRSDVGTWRYDWEKWIPFVPLMIVPYMSIDLFFFAAPLLSRDREECRLLAARCVMAMLLAGVVWLVMPLRLAVERPHIEGWLGTVYNSFVSFDKPYNLCPSLHIGLRTILATFYAQRLAVLWLGGFWVWASHIWFSLIGFSTLLTFQHHFVDVVGGFILAAVCMYLFQAGPLVQPVHRNVRIGMYYVVGGVVFTAVAWIAGGWFAWLLWPAAAMGITAAGYFGVGPGIYRKKEGRLSLPTRVVLLPVLLGQRLSLMYYRRQCRPWDEIAPGVWIGRRLNDTEAVEAVTAGVTAVLDLSAEFSEAKPFLAVNYRSLPILDLTRPTMQQMREAVEFISDEAQRGIVYVHCKIGYSRSAAIVGAYLLATGRAADAEEAMVQLRRVRPSIVIRSEAERALREFSAGMGQNKQKAELTVR